MLRLSLAVYLGCSSWCRNLLQSRTHCSTASRPRLISPGSSLLKFAQTQFEQISLFYLNYQNAQLKTNPQKSEAGSGMNQMMSPCSVFMSHPLLCFCVNTINVLCAGSFISPRPSSHICTSCCEILWGIVGNEIWWEKKADSVAEGRRDLVC